MFLNAVNIHYIALNLGISNTVCGLSPDWLAVWSRFEPKSRL